MGLENKEHQVSSTVGSAQVVDDECVETQEEDSTILAHRRAKIPKQRNHPPPLKMNAVLSSLCFHPEEDLIAISTLDNETSLYSYTNEETTLTHMFEHSECTKDIKFNSDGSELYAAMDDLSMLIFDVEGLKLQRTVENASSDQATSLNVIDENIVAIGGEDGIVTLWDKRSSAKAMTFEVGADSITSLTCDPSCRTLVATCAEGSLSTIKIRGGKISMKSEPYPHGLTCSGIMKQNTKLAVGDTSGRLLLFNWGEFEIHNDIHKVKNSPGINRLIPITEHIVITACDSGELFATYLFPNQVIGIVGNHNKTPITELDVCNDGHLIATGSFGKSIFFWNVEYMADFVPRKLKKQDKSKQAKYHLPSSNSQNPSAFFNDLAE